MFPDPRSKSAQVFERAGRVVRDFANHPLAAQAGRP
jgi:hypothetical protein